MVSEIDNIIKGLVVSTSDFDNNKKIIGVNNDNITPDENGIRPLGKQGAFIKEEKPVEMFEEISAIDSIASAANGNVEETLDFQPKPIETPAAPVAPEPTPAVETPKFILPAAVESDVTTDVPVEVAPTDTLQTMIVETPAPVEVVSAQEESTEKEIELQMPVMDEEVVANEPTGVDNSLFENASGPVSQLPDPSAETVVNPPVAGSDNKTNEVISKMLDELALNISKHVKEDIEQCKNNINNLLNGRSLEESVNQTEAPKTEETDNAVASLETNVMNDAINQINNMVIPDLNGPTL